jgi:succinoglycan biosynthesis transport protein ExoP
MNELGPAPDTHNADMFGEPAAAPNPLLIVHRALRGRYVLAAILAVLLAVPGGLVGYMLIPPKYTSRAVLEAAPTLPALLYENELNENLPAFESFVAQQATSLTSERVLSNAVTNAELRQAGWPSGAAGLVRFRESMSVDTPRRSNQIFVSVTDENPEVARVAAKAVLEAYTAIRNEYEATTFGDRQQRLERLRDDYLRERNEKNRMALDRALSVAETEDLQGAQGSRLEQLADLDEELAAARRELARLKGVSPVAMEDDTEDPELARLLDDRRQLQRRRDALLQTLTPEHREVKLMQAELRAMDAAVDARQAELAGIDTTDPNAPTAQPADRVAAVELRISELETARQDAARQIDRIARTRLDVLALRQEAEEANSRFEDAERRLESLRVEKQSQIIGRIRVAQEPERPLQPSTDRRVPLAGMGFMGGAGAGVAMVAAFGLLLPKLRVADDVASTAKDVALLGMIPDFPDTTDDTDPAARESLHFIRVMMDARSGPGCLVAGITSPQSGDGKTTISYLLARSFALTQRRILLVDSDLVGRGLTRTLNMTPRQPHMGPDTRLADLVVSSGEPGLDVLPASDAPNASDAFCRHLLQRLLTDARDRYDVVLLDTGPILGSIEAAAMTPVVDQMLLVVSRGLEARLLRMSTARLRDLNSAPVGIIFNRANSVDFNRSFAPASSVSRRSTARSNGTSLPGVPRPRDVASAVDREHG